MPNQSRTTSWRRTPADVTLAEDEIHVWLIEAAGSDADFHHCFSLLSSAEQARAEKFRFAKDRRSFTTAHAALRSILSRYLQTLPAKIEFAASANGKPRLASDSLGDLHFNLSHSGELALVAAAWKREVGVDVEQVKEDFGFAEVAERFFTPREVAALRALPAHLQRQAFYQCWTSKEAFLKAKGTGLSGELDEVEIILGDDRHVRIHASVPGWTLAELTLGGDYEAALVVEGGPMPMSCYRWIASPQ